MEQNSCYAQPLRKASVAEFRYQLFVVLGDLIRTFDDTYRPCQLFIEIVDVHHIFRLYLHLVEERRFSMTQSALSVQTQS